SALGVACGADAGRRGSAPPAIYAQCAEAVAGRCAAKLTDCSVASDQVRRTAPCFNQLIASPSRSSPQNSSRPTTKVGEPKIPNCLAASVSLDNASFAAFALASAITRPGSWPISRRLEETLGSLPVSSPICIQRL